jgi:glutamine synthetase
LIAAGVAGFEEGLALPASLEQDPGSWTDDDPRRAGIPRLPSTPAEQQDALLGSERIGRALGEPLLGAFVAVRRADAEWAAARPLEEVIAAHLWLY